MEADYFLPRNRRMRCLAFIALLLVAPTISAADNWPQFRGPNGTGLSDAKGIPTHWSESENIRWKTAIHDKGWSSPVVWGNQVWVTTARADGKEFFAIGLDRSSGKIVHDLKLFTEENPAFCHAFNSYASPTPVIEEGRLYAHFGTHGTACIDTTTGKVIWERRDLHVDHFRGPGSSPILWKNLLILTFDGFDRQYLAALDKTTGKDAWLKDRGIKFPKEDGDLKKGYSTPSILEHNGKPQLVSSAAEATIAYDPASGDELWRVIHGGMNEATVPLFGSGLIFLTNGHKTNLLAVRQGGSGDVTMNIAWRVTRGVPTRPSPLLVGDLLFMVSDAGVASCLEAKTGEVIWQERLGGAFSSSPICVGGNIYMADEDGKTHVVAAERAFKSVSVNKLDAGCMASPAIAGNSLFLRTKTHLYCIAQGQ
jgi:outer membrane protein assembly factor BamB